ncbi:histidine kinase/DNA gyrase B/HSP90-like ATPase [Lacibacter cauensis]|uniref:Histidine kinase/DNA gyrase B/HSP90-like ATPase n=1 Tax=Lacibacter cauensis TaxID=510947 RepID=A0A562SCL8_9BACT|nr:ATP-binding protein [Lacibacter cauensis]TWI79018.1 histidine kinase/DNA gyrase B/HSP90-like ATPase [Lacibacter cauensis]
MTTVSKKITTNSRVIKDLLTKYSDTFAALKELINNSLQAMSKNIEIEIQYTNDLLIRSGITKIVILDDGHGVSYSDFDNRILEIGTTAKKSGQGIGRFSSFQIGELMHIETAAYDNIKKQYSKTNFSIDTTDFRDAQLEQTEFKVDYEYFSLPIDSYYKVTIENLHHNINHKPARKNLITQNFLPQNISQSIFENYPYEIFHDKVKFHVNGDLIKREDFLIDLPIKKSINYIDKKGANHDIRFYFYNIRSSLNKVKVFFQIDNSGIKSVAHEYTYSSDWYTPDLGTWFIYVESDFFNSDLFRNLDIESLGEEEVKGIKENVKEIINDFFKSRNKKFEKFLSDLEKDRYYPYKEELPPSKAQEIIFKKAAYLIEEQHELIKKNDSIRTFLYPLLDKAISNGDVEYIFRKILKMSDDNVQKFRSLLEKTDIEDVVHFANLVSDKLEFLNFLHELTYGDISAYLKERSQLHKIIENELWVFGENYNGTPQLWSDKKIGNILKEIREKYFNYEPSVDDGNLITKEGTPDDITDLFFFNEKVNDSDEREIMVVELKSPKCAIGEKELNQIDRYAFTIEENSGLPSNKVKYKLLLISSKLTKFAKSKVRSRRTSFPEHPFLYDKKLEKNVEVYVMEWAELIEQNKRKLGYLSNQLKVKDKSVNEKFETEYAELITEKISAQLRLVK